MNNLNRLLWATVAVSGLAALIVTVTAARAPGYSVRLAALAALVAVVVLHPDQGVRRGWIVVVLAVAGFLDVVCSWPAADHIGWPDPVMLALTLLQSGAAVAALFTGRRPGPGNSDVDPAYAAYLGYVQAYYYATQFPQQPAAQAVDHAGYHGHESTADLHARYDRYSTPPRDRSAPSHPGESSRAADYSGMPGAAPNPVGSDVSDRARESETGFGAV